MFKITSLPDVEKIIAFAKCKRKWIKTAAVKKLIMFVKFKRKLN